MADKKEEPDEITPPVGWAAVEEYVSEQICELHRKTGDPHHEGTHILQMMAYLSGLTSGIAMHQHHEYDAEILIMEFETYLVAVGESKGIVDLGTLHTAAALELARLVRYAHVGER